MSNSFTGLNVNLHTDLIISYLLKQNELLMYLRFARVATSNSEVDTGSRHTMHQEYLTHII